MLQQFRFDDTVETLSRPSFEPGGMSTLLKQNKAKVLEVVTVEKTRANHVAAV
jgi:hypothetical protein